MFAISLSFSTSSSLFCRILFDCLFINLLFFRFTDAETDQELCVYNLEQTATSTNTAVIMCKMSRERVGGTWSVKALGHVGMGRASNYLPIRQDISDKYENSNNNNNNNNS